MSWFLSPRDRQEVNNYTLDPVEYCSTHSQRSIGGVQAKKRDVQVLRSFPLKPWQEKEEVKGAKLVKLL
ncbi:hypothetical protein Tco_0908815 [Tanacetum coccineum]|uniref:Uncharacterized protein n=1 Tax=Tanacetum coccineum TaxID=301880 RepID=A0ABQ5CPB6_9ASTR